jgi:hypothetical protein
MGCDLYSQLSRGSCVTIKLEETKTMKHPDIKKVEERSSVLKETSHELNKDSLELCSASLRLRATSRKLVEEIKKNIRQ